MSTWLPQPIPKYYIIEQSSSNLSTTGYLLIVATLRICLKAVQAKHFWYRLWVATVMGYHTCTKPLHQIRMRHKGIKGQVFQQVREDHSNPVSADADTYIEHQFSAGLLQANQEAPILLCWHFHVSGSILEASWSSMLLPHLNQQRLQEVG